jgi:hypothetical protein
MAGPSPVAINIVVNAGSAQEAIAKMRAEIARLEPAGVAAGRGATEANKGLAGLKTEMGRGRETAMFFTQALGEFGPQGRTAQIALSGLAGAFIGGGGLLAVLSLAQAAVRVFTARQVELAKEAEAARKAIKDLADEAARLGTTTSRSAVAQAQLIQMRKSEAEMQSALAQAIADDDEERTDKIREDLKRLENDRIQITYRIAGLRAAEAEAAAKVRKAERETAAKKEAKSSLTLEDVFSAHDALTDLYKSMGALRDSLWAGMSADVPMPTPAEWDAMAAATERAAFAAQTWEDAWSNAAASVESSLQGLAGSFAQSFSPMLTQSASFTEAMQEAGGAAETMGDTSGAAYAKMAQDALAALAVEAASRAIFEGAMALASLAVDNYKAAAQHGAAAAAFGVVAGVAGGAAYAIGQNRGMTASEKQQVEAARNANQTSLGSSSLTGSDSEIIKRETVYVIAPGGFTEAEVARVTARSIAAAERLGYMRGAEAT